MSPRISSHKLRKLTSLYNEGDQQEGKQQLGQIHMYSESVKSIEENKESEHNWNRNIKE